MGKSKVEDLLQFYYVTLLAHRWSDVNHRWVVNVGPEALYCILLLHWYVQVCGRVLPNPGTEAAVNLSVRSEGTSN